MARKVVLFNMLFVLTILRLQRCEKLQSKFSSDLKIEQSGLKFRIVSEFQEENRIVLL
jgi:hypothetical protein